MASTSVCLSSTNKPIAIPSCSALATAFDDLLLFLVITLRANEQSPADRSFGKGWLNFFQILLRSTGDTDVVRRPDHPMRLVVVKIRPHVSGGKYKGGSSGVDRDGFLRIATNLLDVPAEIIALLYAYRWTIEIFFRQFKHLLGCRHLLSHNQNGITIQTYCAIIACLVIALWTGRKPTKRTHEMVCFHMMGWATTEEIEAHLAKLKLADAKPAKKV